MGLEDGPLSELTVTRGTLITDQTQLPQKRFGSPTDIKCVFRNLVFLVQQSVQETMKAK